MDTIESIIDEKGRTVFTIRPQASVTEAVQLMTRRRVGAVLVCEEDRCVGIFTERDLMNRVVLTGRDPAATPVAEVMTPEVACVEPGTTAAEAMAIMTERRCRHLPVVEGGRVVGIVSIGDLVRRESRSQQFEIRMLTDYIQGKYPG
ncbi:MAG TPA: CBS domain-containing protein [Thermoanaerobaculaceae bacterium]|nr:CBS domain-containing protein [Thermoanaerobaculaceae bacterium]HRS15434.1 CBS domain-containing protein [Thermoanaerobaculaceae bacterium]